MAALRRLLQGSQRVSLLRPPGPQLAGQLFGDLQRVGHRFDLLPQFAFEFLPAGEFFAAGTQGLGPLGGGLACALGDEVPVLALGLQSADAVPQRGHRRGFAPDVPCGAVRPSARTLSSRLRPFLERPFTVRSARDGLAVDPLGVGQGGARVAQSLLQVPGPFGHREQLPSMPRGGFLEFAAMGSRLLDATTRGPRSVPGYGKPGSQPTGSPPRPPSVPRPARVSGLSSDSA